MNQPLIQFLLCLESLIQNIYSNTSYSRVGDENNDIEVGMDDLLWHNHDMDRNLLNAFQQDELGDDAHITNIFYEFLEFYSTTPLFRHGQGPPK